MVHRWVHGRCKVHGALKRSVWMKSCLVAKVYGWMNEKWIDEWMDGCIDEWMDGRKNERTYLLGQTDQVVLPQHQLTSVRSLE